MAWFGRGDFRAADAVPALAPGSVHARRRREFDRLCAEDTGETVMVLQLRLRAEEAARILAETRHRPSETGWATGFSDASHLSRTLK